MNKDDFIDIFKELIQTDDDIALDTRLEDVEEWDSMAIMAMMAWYDVEKGVKTDFDALMALETVGDLAKLSPDYSE